MQRLCVNRFLGRVSSPSSHQVRSFQPALRVAPYDSALPDFIYRALLVDAAGTLLIPSEPAAQVYLRYGGKYGVTLSPEEVLTRFRRAYNLPWTSTPQRYVGDGRPFWQRIVTQSTGCENPLFFEEVYSYYARAEAWNVAPGAAAALQKLKEAAAAGKLKCVADKHSQLLLLPNIPGMLDAGMKLAIVSNFDTRLRPILQQLGLEQLFDSILISAEIGVEKPNPTIFEKACQQLGVLPEETVHVGDDRRNDIFGARDAGCFAWLWGLDVLTFDEVSRKMLHEEHDEPNPEAILSPLS